MYLEIGITVLMVAIKAIFSAADTAYTYLNKIKISQMSKKDKKARKIKTMLEDKNRFLGTIEVVITMIELLASTYTAAVFVNPLAIKITNLPIQISYEIAIILSLAIITIVLSYILLVFGGILPRQIARNHPEKTAYRLINIVWIVSKLNKPFEKLVRKSTSIFKAVFGIQTDPKDRLTEKEIKMLIRESKDQGVIDKLEQEILFNTLKLDDIVIKQIMVPKEKVTFINVEDTKEEIAEKIQKYKYTRMPVYKGNTDNIIGLFNIKDIIIEYTKSNTVNLDINKFLRKIILVNKDEKVSEVFRMMQLNDQLMVVVVDDKRKVVGTVTMEDILEKLVGNILDEYDEKDNI